MAGPFDFLFPNAEAGVRQAQRASLGEQLRQAGAVAAQGATRGATNPVALSAGIARAQQGTRAANAAQFAGQLQQAREADRNMGQRLLGMVGNIAGSALGMAIPGAGPAVSPIAGMAGQALGGAIGSMGAPKSPQAPPAGLPTPLMSPQPQGMAGQLGDPMTGAPPLSSPMQPPPNPYAQAAMGAAATALDRGPGPIPNAPSQMPAPGPVVDPNRLAGEELRRRNAQWLLGHPAAQLGPPRYQ